MDLVVIILLDESIHSWISNINPTLNCIRPQYGLSYQLFRMSLFIHGLVTLIQL